MNKIDGRDLDLNLLRVFVTIAEAGSVTAAAQRLYLTQSAVSAALKRLTVAVGTPLFARSGRGLVLTARGQRLRDATRPHLEALVAAALSPAVFDPRASERTMRIGLSDASEGWLLPPLLRAMAKEAPRMRLIVLEVHFRSVAMALSTQSLDLAVTVADDLPAGTERRRLFAGNFVCLFDPRHARLRGKLTKKRYFHHDHVVVSYNGDLRGIVEDLLGMQRRVRISVPTFHAVGPVVEGTSLLATVPTMIARQITAVRPALRMTALPFALGSDTGVELIWRSALEDDEAVRFVRQWIVRIAEAAGLEGAGR